MWLTKSSAYSSNSITRTDSPSNTSMDTSVEPPMPSKFMMTQNYVGTITGQPQEMNLQPQNHDQGMYYYVQGALLYGILNYRRQLPCIL